MPSNKNRKNSDKRGLDRIDTGITLALQNNARLSNKELAATVGLSPSACLERVRRLRDSGVLTAFSAEVDPAALGIGLQAMIAIKLRLHDRGSFQTLLAYLLELPEVIDIFELAGDDDLLVHVVCRDSSHLRDFMADSIGSRTEHSHLVTSLIYEHHRVAGLPDLRRPEEIPD